MCCAYGCKVSSAPRRRESEQLVHGARCSGANKPKSPTPSSGLSFAGKQASPEASLCRSRSTPGRPGMQPGSRAKRHEGTREVLPVSPLPLPRASLTLLLSQKLFFASQPPRGHGPCQSSLPLSGSHFRFPGGWRGWWTQFGSGAALGSQPRPWVTSLSVNVVLWL